MSAVVDLPRARRAFAALDKLAADNPDRCQRIGNWTESDAAEIVMGTPAKTRVAQYRARLRDKGYRGIYIFAPESTIEKLKALAESTGMTYGDLIKAALDQFEADR
jgi:hypothetical protein